MLWKNNVLWTMLAICFLGAVIGCEKPAGGDKSAPPKSNPVPANTTDSK